MKNIFSFDEFLNESVSSRPKVVSAVNINTDFDASTGEAMFNDIAFKIPSRGRALKRGLNYTVKPSDKFVVVHSTGGSDGEASYNEFPGDFGIFGTSAATLDDAKAEALKKLGTTEDELDDMVMIMDLGTGKEHNFDKKPTTVAPENENTEKEAEEFLSGLSNLMSKDLKPQDAVKELKTILDKLPEAKRALYRSTRAYQDYLDKFFDFYPTLKG